MNIDNWTFEEMETAVKEFREGQDSLNSQPEEQKHQVEEEQWVDLP